MQHFQAHMRLITLQPAPVDGSCARHSLCATEDLQAAWFPCLVLTPLDLPSPPVEPGYALAFGAHRPQHRALGKIGAKDVVVWHFPGVLYIKCSPGSGCMEMSMSTT